MDADDATTVVELRVSARFASRNPWVVQAITGFLSAYFMEYPGFRVQRQAHELESGMHVWRCEVPVAMKIPRLLKRLQQDLPPSRTLTPDMQPDPVRYIIDCPEA